MNNNGSWEVGLWLRKIINDAKDFLHSWIGTVEFKVDTLIEQESTNSQTINNGIQESTDNILNAVEGIQNLFKSASEATLEPSQALEGETFWNGTVLKTGTMKDMSDTTVDIQSIVQDDTYVYVPIPIKAHYNENSMLRIKQTELFVVQTITMTTGKSVKYTDKKVICAGIVSSPKDTSIYCNYSENSVSLGKGGNAYNEAEWGEQTASVRVVLMPKS